MWVGGYLPTHAIYCKLLTHPLPSGQTMCAVSTCLCFSTSLYLLIPRMYAIFLWHYSLFRYLLRDFALWRAVTHQFCCRCASAKSNVSAHLWCLDHREQEPHECPPLVYRSQGAGAPPCVLIAECSAAYKWVGTNSYPIQSGAQCT